MFISFMVASEPVPLRCNVSARFGSTYTKIEMIQTRFAWPPCDDDTHIREVFHIFTKKKKKMQCDVVMKPTVCDLLCSRKLEEGNYFALFIRNSVGMS